VGVNTTATLYIEYSNTGSLAMPAPLLVLNGTEKPLLTLNQNIVSSGVWTSAVPEGFSDSIQLLACGETAGVLQPGESKRVPVYFAGLQTPLSGNTSIQFSLGVLAEGDNSEAASSKVDWSSLKIAMRPSEIDAGAWDAIWANFLKRTGTTWTNYVRMLDDTSTYLSRQGLRVTDVNQLLAFEILLANGLNPLSTLVSVIDVAIEAPGLSLAFARIFGGTISSRYSSGILGRGWTHNWDYSLKKASDGTITLKGPGGSARTFQPDRRNGSYFVQAGDQGTLSSLGGGTFSLRETDGLLYVFRADGQLDFLKDLNGNRITAGYTGGRLVSLTHSAGQRLQLTYNNAGLLQSITDSLDHQTVYNYDETHQYLLSVQYYDRQVTRYAYSTGQDVAYRHALTRITFADDSQRNFAYNAQGYLSQTSLNNGAEAVSFTYNGGRITGCYKQLLLRSARVGNQDRKCPRQCYKSRLR
jgi:YD repeat-containing protein